MSGVVECDHSAWSLMDEQWKPGDVVLAADGEIWKRTDGTGYRGLVVDPPVPWLRFDDSYPKAEAVPVRPLVLLVRDGKPAPCSRCEKAREHLVALTEELRKGKPWE